MQYLTVAFLALWMSIAVGGILFVKTPQRRVVGCIVLIEALFVIGLQIALSTIPFGIGQPLIRVQFWHTLFQSAGILAIIGLVSGVVLIVGHAMARWLDGSTTRPLMLLGVLTVPLIAGTTGLYGLMRAGTPAREVNRNPLTREITLAQGFTANIFVSEKIDNPTALAFGPDGALYIADISGSLWRSVDADGDGHGETVERFADGFSLLVGLAWRDDELFTSSSGKIEALRDTNGDGVADQRRVVVDDLPSMILKPHSNNGLVFGKDGRLYFGVGSTTEGNVEENPLAAGILSVNPDGTDLKMFARGLGNNFGLAFNAAGALFGGDNSPQAVGDESAPPDEFNWIVEGGHYGFPYFYGDPPKNGGTRNAIVSFPAHSVPTGVTFYTGSTYPVEYHDSGFVTLWGNGELVRIEVGKASSGNYLGHAVTFASGFLYPIAVITGPDGNLYVADFGTSTVYRITYDPNKAF